VGARGDGRAADAGGDRRRRPQHPQRALHRRGPGQRDLGGGPAPRVHGRGGSGAGLRQRQLHRPRPARRAGHRRGAGARHRRDRRGPLPRRRDPERVLRRHPRSRGRLRPGDRERPVRELRAERPAAQRGRPQHPQPFHHQVAAPGPGGRPGRRRDLPVHDGRAEPGRSPRDRRHRRPGGRGAAAQRSPPAGGGNLRRHRPARLPPPRGGPEPRRDGVGEGRHADRGRRRHPGQRVLPRPPRRRDRRDARRPRTLQRARPHRRPRRRHPGGAGPRPGPHHRLGRRPRADLDPHP
jgi:hypothetical protein